MCTVLEVTRQGYNKWLKSQRKPYKHETLLAQIHEILAEDEENGLTVKKKRSLNSLTKADKEAQKSENLIKQDFTAEEPNVKWLSDITEIPCADGKLYVAPVFDCFDGAIVGLIYRKQLFWEKTSIILMDEDMGI